MSTSGPGNLPFGERSEGRLSALRARSVRLPAPDVSGVYGPVEAITLFPEPRRSVSSWVALCQLAQEALAKRH